MANSQSSIFRRSPRFDSPTVQDVVQTLRESADEPSSLAVLLTAESIEAPQSPVGREGRPLLGLLKN